MNVNQSQTGLPLAFRGSRLCTECNTLIGSSERFCTLNRKAYDGMSFRSWCRLCDIVAQRVKDWVEVVHAQHDLRTMEVSLIFFQESQTIYIQLYCPKLIPLGFLQMCAMADHANNFPEQNVDHLGRVRRWLTECQQNHEHPRRACFTRFTAPIDITFIDVEAACLVKGSTRSKYFALSYVWGDAASTLKATTENQGRLEQPGSLKDSLNRIGRLINDAMELVRRIGGRYLWVDSLCIQQDNPSQKDSQIKLMDIVYGQALATIVAVTSTSVHDGIPGVSQPMIGTPVHELASGMSLEITVPKLQKHLEPSVFEKRAWTFQERVLSQRCIFMTHYGAFLRCPSGIDTPSVSGGLDSPESQISFLHEEPGPQSTLTWERGFDDFAKILENYAGRSLTYQGDTVNAVSGVLSVFQAGLGGDMIAGMPELELDRALLWQYYNGAQRNPLFPSWSWAGWRGTRLMWPHRDIHSAVQRYQWNKVSPRKTIRRSIGQSRYPSDKLATILPIREPVEFEALYFNADVTNAAALAMLAKKYPEIKHGVESWSLKTHQDGYPLDLVLLATLVQVPVNYCIVLSVKWIEEYAERVGLHVFKQSTWERAPKRRMSIALR